MISTQAVAAHRIWDTDQKTRLKAVKTWVGDLTNEGNAAEMRAYTKVILDIARAVVACDSRTRPETKDALKQRVDNLYNEVKILHDDHSLNSLLGGLPPGIPDTDFFNVASQDALNVQSHERGLDIGGGGGLGQAGSSALNIVQRQSHQRGLDFIGGGSLDIFGAGVSRPAGDKLLSIPVKRNLDAYKQSQESGHKEPPQPPRTKPS